MELKVGDIIEMKKAHPCNNKNFLILRTGLDYKLKCIKCGHEIMSPRLKIDKYIKKVIKTSED